MERFGLFLTCGLLATALGCQQSEPAAPKDALPPQVTPVSSSDSQAPKAQSPKPQSPKTLPPKALPRQPKKSDSSPAAAEQDSQQPKTSDQPTLSDLPQEAPVEHPFEPPFGERVELFIPPTRGDVNVQRKSPEAVGTPDVTLKGFVKVGTQRAVLLIGKEVAFLEEGQEKEGLQVISIEPPLVTLQKGRHRWTVSLFEEKQR